MMTQPGQTMNMHSLPHYQEVGQTQPQFCDTWYIYN